MTHQPDHPGAKHPRSIREAEAFGRANGPRHRRTTARVTDSSHSRPCTCGEHHPDDWDGWSPS